MPNLSSKDEFEYQKGKLLKAEAEYFQSMGGSWSFIAMVQKSRTNLRCAYTEIRDAIMDYTLSKKLDENEYIRHTELALDFLSGFNTEMQDAMGIDRGTEYFDLWQSVNFVLSDIKNIPNKHPHLPRNLDNFTQIARMYIRNKAIQCNYIDRLIIDFMAFVQLNSATSTSTFYGTLETTLFERLFFKSKARAKTQLSDQLKSLTNIYIQCSEHMFNPTVIHHLASEVRRRVDFYEAIFFEVLDSQILRRRLDCEAQ